MAISWGVRWCMIYNVTKSKWVYVFGWHLDKLLMSYAALLAKHVELIVDITKIGAWRWHRVWELFLVVEPVAIETFEVGSHTILWRCWCRDCTVDYDTWEESK